METVTNADGVAWKIHESGQCLGKYCPFHKPSKHEYRYLPWRIKGKHVVRVLPEGPEVLDPDDYEYLRWGRAILVNRARCLSCKDVVVSEHRWDYQTCSCGAMAVDGGQEYLRRIGEFEELSWVEDGEE